MSDNTNYSNRYRYCWTVFRIKRTHHNISIWRNKYSKPRQKKYNIIY
ncbi:hypothetical protein [uncultured Methanobrevibacter sp.]|nr:hypothetical protein [uncultured Methanobrevibacter sp.]